MCRHKADTLTNIHTPTNTHTHTHTHGCKTAKMGSYHHSTNKMGYFRQTLSMSGTLTLAAF